MKRSDKTFRFSCTIYKRQSENGRCFISILLSPPERRSRDVLITWTGTKSCLHTVCTYSGIAWNFSYEETRIDYCNPTESPAVIVLPANRLFTVEYCYLSLSTRYNGVTFTKFSFSPIGNTRAVVSFVVDLTIREHFASFNPLRR